MTVVAWFQDAVALFAPILALTALHSQTVLSFRQTECGWIIRSSPERVMATRSIHSLGAPAFVDQVPSIAWIKSARAGTELLAAAAVGAAWGFAPDQPK